MWLLIVEAWLQSQDSPYGTCDRQWHWAGFSQSTSLFPSYHSTCVLFSQPSFEADKIGPNAAYAPRDPVLPHNNIIIMFSLHFICSTTGNANKFYYYSVIQRQDIVQLWNVFCFIFQYVHFLSHCHADHIVGLTSTWRLPVYTTHFNAWMLKNKFKVSLTHFDLVVVHLVFGKTSIIGPSVCSEKNVPVTS